MPATTALVSDLRARLSTIRSLFTAGLLAMAVSAPAQADLPEDVTVLLDDNRGVTCWVFHRVGAAGMSCLPNADLVRPEDPPRVSAVRSVWDGDTFRADVAGWPPLIGEDVPIRLRDVQAPERRSRCEDPAAREAEQALAEQARLFVAVLLTDAEVITLHDVGRGSFFRVLADVRLDGESLGARLLAEGYAIPYVEGSEGLAWCDKVLPDAAS